MPCLIEGLAGKSNRRAAERTKITFRFASTRLSFQRFGTKILSRMINFHCFHCRLFFRFAVCSSGRISRFIYIYVHRETSRRRFRRWRIDDVKWSNFCYRQSTQPFNTNERQMIIIDGYAVCHLDASRTDWGRRQTLSSLFYMFHCYRHRESHERTVMIFVRGF